MICERCGMYYPERLHTWEELLGVVPMGPGEPFEHVCPEPFDRETARALLSHYAATGAVTTNRIKARIRLGLRGESAHT